MNDPKYVIQYDGKYLMGVRLAPVPDKQRIKSQSIWTSKRANAMKWDSQSDALRALQALELDKQGAEVTRCH